MQQASYSTGHESPGKIPVSDPLPENDSMPASLAEIEKHLWDAADELRANSKLKSSEYSIPVLGLIFLRYADHKYALAEETYGRRIGRLTK
jgi:type I restriction-modification system DNA methylase subunit